MRKGICLIVLWILYGVRGAYAVEPVVQNKTWLGDITTGLSAVEALATDQVKFDEASMKLWKGAHANRKRRFLVDVPVGDVVALLEKLLKIAPKAPFSFYWIKMQEVSVEMAVLRLGIITDSTEDKKILESTYWVLLQAAARNLEHLQAEYIRAGGEKAANEPSSAGIYLGAAVENDPVLQKRRAELEYKRSAASALRNAIPSLQALLTLQCTHALPGMNVEAQRSALGKRGFSVGELDSIFGKAAGK